MATVTTRLNAILAQLDLPTVQQLHEVNWNDGKFWGMKPNEVAIRFLEEYLAPLPVPYGFPKTMNGRIDRIESALIVKAMVS